jgi:hypothetical protein
MLNVYADDGRILTPPAELEPLLRGSFQAFTKVLGHLRFFYMADEIWDGKTSIIFKADSEQLAAITLDDGLFMIHIGDKETRIMDETALDNIFQALKKTIPIRWHRPYAQLTVNPDPNVYPCGYRCDLCLGSKNYDENDVSEKDNFGYLNWVCYHGCLPNIEIERDDHVFVCSGCNKNRNKFCQSFTCSREKGYANCAECGDYYSCDVYRGSHYAGQCNLGITAEEVTKLVIPYCMKERLDVLRNN